MNRKIKNKKQEKQEQQKKVMNPKILVISSIVLVIVLIGGLLFDQLYERKIMTLDGEAYHLDDLSYYFYSIESQYDYYDQMFGGAYWDMTYDEASGATMRDAARQESIDSALYTELLYKEATSEGYELTEEETTAIETDVTSLMDEQLTPAIIKKNDFTKAYLTKMLSKSAIVERYRKDKIDALDINDENIRAGVDKEANRQYEIEYLFIATQTTNAEGTVVPISAEEKTAAFDKINAFSETVKTTEDWSTLIPEGETALTYTKDSFITSDEKFAGEFKTKMMAMENGDITEVYEAENGYYIVRMTNNNSNVAYETAVGDAIAEEENLGFSAIYQEVSLKHEYSYNDKYLKTLTMGRLTLAE